MLPFLETSYLPFSSSFFSAVTQPLGLRYISASAANTSASGSPSITYGTADTARLPVFELRQITPTGGRPLRLSHIVFSAPSAQSVRDFLSLARKAKERRSTPGTVVGEAQRPPGSEQQSLLQPSSEPSESRGIDADRGSSGSLVKTPGGEERARVTDLDGNIMEVVYVPPADYPPHYSGSTVRKTQSTQDEVGRILHWNYNVATQGPIPSKEVAPVAAAPPTLVAGARRPGRFADDRPYPVLRRSVTATSTTVFGPADPAHSPRRGSSGLSAGSVVSTILGVATGVALGAGITYGAMRNERSRTSAQPVEAPLFQRRSSFPVRLADSRSRWAEVRRDVAEYSDEYTAVADRRPPPAMLGRHTRAALPGYDGDGGDDGRSRHSSRYRAPGTPSVRSRREVAASRTPLVLTDVEHRDYAGRRHSAVASEFEDIPRDHGSHVSSRHSVRSRHTSTAPPPVRRSSALDVADAGSHASARSQRTVGTPRGQSQPATRPASKGTSRVSTATAKAPGSQAATARSLSRANSYVSARDVPLPSGKASSYMAGREVSFPRRKAGTSRVSARQVPLPASGVGSSHADWDDDADSIAPSDSISCVGSRQMSRLYH